MALLALVLRLPGTAGSGRHTCLVYRRCQPKPWFVHAQDEAKEAVAQRHKAELQQQMASHEDARRAERAARAAEARSIKVRTSLGRMAKGFVLSLKPYEKARCAECAARGVHGLRGQG